ncbi:EF-hand domain pair [Phytophthora cinnamomi]|uniref:EF-hand domain pair n=1 Tax=Phytophthora cinnamomi TaxID=4785 RepID=UPI00355978D5|nr:EF-hand domain pair [Phytophthora cinnamomi]
MASAFYWECEAFQVAVAPWSSDPSRQRAVCARVSVAEQRTPGFALRFDLELLEKPAENGAEMGTGRHLMRLVNQRQMLRAFEFAFVGPEAEQRRPPGGEEGGDELLDRQLKKWLAGGGQVQAPPKEELARWLLAWMIVAPAGEDSEGDKLADEWVVLMCGEKGAEYVYSAEQDLELFAGEPGGDSSEPVVDDGGGKDLEERDDDSEQETEDDEDLPPPYEEVEVIESSPPSYDPPEEETEVEAVNSGDEKQEDAAVARPAETKRSRGSSRDSPSEDVQMKQSSKKETSVRSSSNRILANSLASTAPTEQQNEKPSLKPAIVRLNPRLDSLDVVKLEEPSGEWT